MATVQTERLEATRMRCTWEPAWGADNDNGPTPVGRRQSARNRYWASAVAPAPIDLGGERAQTGDANEEAKFHMKGPASVKLTKARTDVAGNKGRVDDRGVVYVLDDDISIRQPLEAVIVRAGWRCEFFSSAREFLSKSECLEEGCLLVDINLPDLADLDPQQRAAGRQPEAPIVFLAQSADVRIAVQAMKRGAVDFLTKPCEDDVLVSALQEAFVRNQEAIDRARAMQAIEGRRACLSRREHEVMALVVAGRLNKQIAYELGISEITVKAHRGQVMRKMEARTLAGLVTMAGRIGFPAPSA